MSDDDLPTADVEPAVRVHVSPSQASYFAGEQFSVTITFTNIRTPESPKVKNSHKRGAHSISSAPLARPPTSAGLPRPLAPSLTSVNNARDLPVRRRLIGQVPGKLDMSTVLEQKRQSLLEKARSLSIDIPTGELFQTGTDTANESGSRYVRAYNEFSDAGLPTRSPDFQLPPRHPHARKHSVTDVQIHLNDAQHPPPVPPSSSGSTFSLALDPIAETPTSSYPGTPLPRSPSVTDSLDQRSQKTAPPVYPSRYGPPRRPSQLDIGIGYGPPPNPQSQSVTSFQRNTLVGSNTELILYSYAQLSGTVSITPLPGATMSVDQAQTLSALRLKLSKRTIVGGGSMDITSHQRIQECRRSHGRSSSLTSGFFSLLSPSTYSAPSTPLPSSQSWAPGRSRTPSVSLSGTTANGHQGSVGLGLINGGAEEDIDPDAPLPTFGVQPAMLAVDLMLAPGASRTYTYTVSLPENLPPTFRGRALKFSYELVVGTCRAGVSAMRSSSSLGPTGANSISRVMKVPIRVYNHVAVGKVPKPYDLLWPVGRRTFSIDATPKVVDGPPKETKVPAQSYGSMRSLEDLREYGQRLLATFSDPDAAGVRMRMPLEVAAREQADFEREQERDGGVLTGCREAVEILTRNPKKVSYDVNKDGLKVAVLTFTKSAYRLGETVLGVVELNERQGRSRVLSLSAMLESQEILPSQIASAGHLRHMRRVHAEHHASLVSCVLRTTFSLDIPSDASPAFQVALSHPPSGSAGGLVWRVRLSLLVAVATESSQADDDGVRLRHLAQDGAAGEWGTPYTAYPSIAPKARPRREAQTVPASTTWTQFLMSSLLGSGEREYPDGDETAAGGMRGGDGEGWEDVRVETVECEVPIRVWPGNTAFKASPVVFDV